MTQPTPKTEISAQIAVGAVLITYLGFGITIWVLTKSFAIEIIYFLVVALVVVTWRCIALTRHATALASEVEQAKDSRVTAGALADLAHVDSLATGLIGMVVHLMQPPHTDTQHHMTYVREEYIVHGDDGTFNWLLVGHNALQTDSSTLFIKIAGDSPLDISEIPISAIDRLHDDTELNITCIGDRPNSKAYSIEFLEPLHAGDTFEIQLNCRWDKTFLRTRQHDYVYFQWGAFAELGIDRLVGRLVCDVPIADFVLERLEDGKRLREPKQPRVMDASDRHTVLEWEVIHPIAIYVLSFTKLLPSER